MNRPHIYDYKALLLGGIITFGLAVMLHQVGLLLIDSSTVTKPLYITINSLGLLFCWLVLSFLLHQLPIYKTLSVLSLLIAVIIAESYMDVPDNPISIPLLILFWLGVTYLILPRLFQKYKVALLLAYGSILLYFFVFRSSPDYAEQYRPVVSNFLLIAISVMIIAWLYEQWQWLSTLQADKAKAELTLLKNQLNPHFFFNTLNNLYGLTVEQSEQAPTMILKLSDMMRYTIYEGSTDLVPLVDEVAYLKNFIDLHKIRHQKRVTITVEKEITHSHSIAPLLLIIPLENAFKHGVEKLVEEAFIHMNIKTTKTAIHFEVINNYDATAESPIGIGLKNIKRRLALLYPSRHNLSINKSDDLFSFHLTLYTQNK